jgi:hypothetical protein
MQPVERDGDEIPPSQAIPRTPGRYVYYSEHYRCKEHLRQHGTRRGVGWSFHRGNGICDKQYICREFRYQLLNGGGRYFLMKAADGE